LTPRDAVGYAVGEPAAKGGLVLYRVAFIANFKLLTVIHVFNQFATAAEGR
jgi:hypothetical protein